MTPLGSRPTDDGNNPNPKGRLCSDSVVLKTRGKPLKIGTWNVRTLYQAGKLANALQEMNSMNIDILGLADTRWTGSGKIVKENHTMIYSGGNDHYNGVGIILRNKIANTIMGYWAISDRVLMVKLQGRPFNITIIQVYAPTQDHSDEEIEEFYEEIQRAIKSVKSDDVLCVMGDLNAKVGDKKVTNITGNYGLGDKNERGERLIQFCEQNNLTIANTLFKQPIRRIYTWKSPGDIVRNQIDFIMINQRFRNSIKQAKTYPGADINSDYNSVTIKMEIN